MALLIDTEEELKRANSSVTLQLCVDDIRSFLDDADNKYIIPAIGAQMYNITAGDKDVLPASHAEIFQRLIQKAAVNFAIAEFANFGAVEISSAGISVSKSETRLPASDKKIMALRKNSFALGWSALELALNYMEDNLAYFGIYANSSARLPNVSRFINASRDFAQKLPVSAELFFSIKGIITRVEEDYIEPILGEGLTITVRNWVLTPNGMNPIERKLLEMVRTAVSSLAIAEAIPYRLVSFDGSGVYVKSESVGGISGNVENSNPADDTRLQMIMNRLIADAQRDMERLRKWLTAHNDVFGTYVPSTEDVLNNVNDDPNGAVYFL